MAGLHPNRRSYRLLGCAVLSVFLAGAAGYWIAEGSDAARGLRARMRHPHVILVSFDTLNVWYTSLFDQSGAQTPALEEMAAGGVWFERAYAHVPITLPSHAALLTGQPPWRLGVLANGDVVPEDARTLAEVLSDHGYETAAFLSLGVLDPGFALNQGFGHYDPVPRTEIGRFYRTADEVVEPAARWIEAHRREPFFAWVHLSDPHSPYVAVDEPPDTELLLDDSVVGRWTLGKRERVTVRLELPPGRHTLRWQALPAGDGSRRPTLELEILGSLNLVGSAVESLEGAPLTRTLQPAWEIELQNPGAQPMELGVSFRGRWLETERADVRRRYRAQVTYADRHLGELRRLVERLGMSDQVLWVVVSDHGEGLFHHDTGGHAPFNREEQLRTLLILEGPSLPEGRRLARPTVSLQDVFPTVLDLLGLRLPGPIEGRSLASCWGEDGCGAAKREWIAYGLDRDRRLASFSVYRWPWKALWSSSSRPGVYDVRRHPREERRAHGLSRDLGALPGFAAAIEDPVASALVERLHRHIVAFDSVLARRGRGELTDGQREMLEGLGYL